MSLDVELIDATGAVVYSDNITHNLNTMANEAGVYECLWWPGKHGMSLAGQLLVPLTAGLQMLAHEPSRFEAFDRSNGSGTWRDFLPFCAKYLEACRLHPEAHVRVSR